MLRISFVIGLYMVLISPLFLLSHFYAILSCILVYLFTGGSYWVKIAWKTLGRDLYGGKCLFKIEYKMRSMVRNKFTLADVFLENAQKFPKKKAFISADNDVSFFNDANQLSNKIANYFLESGYKKGDVVSIMMENRVEYIPVWLGLSKVGIISSLINTNLKTEGLEHCLNVSNSKALIYTEDFEEVVNKLSIEKIELFKFSDVADRKNIKPLLSLIASANVSEPPKQDITLLDKLMYIYTSGTTGFPKAAIIRGVRFAYMGYGNGIALKFSSNEIAYCPLPLYHTTGGVGLAGGCLFYGCTLIVRKRFSASKFFEDCCKYNCTVFNYIGEVCTYLLAQPKRSFDSRHLVRKISGAGLRPSVWREFQERFNIPVVCEMYGATEGNATVINLSNRVGAVGFKSRLLPFLMPVKLLKLDKETGEILRGPDGIALEAPIGEPGEMVGKIKTDAVRQFDGYVSKEATKKTLIHNIFTHGDSAFRTGDILVEDEEGYFYFQDRTGDTFRWKGENVSTNEVEGVISKCLDMVEVCVYGVQVPNAEGRAGMACIADPHNKICIDDVYERIRGCLPSYAIPIFIRRSNELFTTGSFKYQKVKLQKQGFNIEECRDDQLFVFDKSKKVYRILDEQLYNDIRTGSFPV